MKMAAGGREALPFLGYPVSGTQAVLMQRGEPGGHAFSARKCSIGKVTRQTPAQRARSRLDRNDCDGQSPSLADDTNSLSGRYLPPAACLLPSQVPFSVSLDHLPESSPFLSLPVNW